MEWISLAENRDKWLAVVYMEMNFLNPYIGENVAALEGFCAM